jgi:ABC-2 type transport system ATP-binding protein
MHAQPPIAVETIALSKIYTTKRNHPVCVVDNLNLAVAPGQVFGFLGANGAGKTTTIKMICSLVRPTSGSARVNGYDVARSRTRVMAQIGAVLEGTRNIYWPLSPWENLLYFAQLKGCWGRKPKLRAEQMLRELDLWERRHEPVARFSRGMQQKVAVACALIADPPVLLLDEPTLGLDIQASYTLKRWIRQLAREQGKTVILTSHQLDVVQEVCDRIAIIHKGRLIVDQPVRDLLKLFQQDTYQIKIKSTIAEQPLTCLEGLHFSAQDAGESVLIESIPDQDALYCLLEQIRKQQIELLAVNRVEPKLEEVFMRLMKEEE